MEAINPNEPTTGAEPRPWLWTTVYFTVLAAMVADANLGLLGPPWRTVLRGLVLVLVVAVVVSSHRQGRVDGPPSRALDTFNYRVMFGVGACVVTFAVAAGIHRALPPGSPVQWGLALATAVPLLFVIWAMGRYLADETDEYLRHLATTSALIGLAAVLVVATVWGFLENVRLVPHVWAWSAVPLFAVAYGVARAWLTAGGR